jgi:16S rRNA processing protein RimM
MSTDSSPLLVIGKITAVYGVKGWVKIHSYTDPVESFISYAREEGETVFLGEAGKNQTGLKTVQFDQIKRHGKGLVAHIRGVDDRDIAASYTRQLVSVSRQNLPALESDEYYWHQLEGLTVLATDAEGTEVVLGKVDHLVETGANDVLVVKKCQGSIDDRERLIPYLPEQVIKEINIDAGQIRVDWDPEF